jgi:hypothetical protein
MKTVTIEYKIYKMDPEEVVVASGCQNFITDKDALNFLKRLDLIKTKMAYRGACMTPPERMSQVSRLQPKGWGGNPHKKRDLTPDACQAAKSNVWIMKVNISSK